MATCAFCDANFETGPGDVLLVCPYCGTAQTKEGDKFKEHYMVRVHFNQTDAQTTLLDWVSKQLGAPEDLATQAAFINYKLHFYPMWVSRVDSHSTYQGYGRDANFYDEWPQRRGAYKRIDFFHKPESGQFTRRHEVIIPGMSNLDEDVKNHPIPTRAKEYFSHAHAEEHDGVVHHSQISEQQAREMAKNRAYELQTALILDEITNIENRHDDINVGETYLIHVPVWELVYRYGNGKYTASVAAATGYVIESKYPRSRAFRAMGMGFGFLSLIIGAALIVIATNILGIQYIPGGGLVSGGMLAILGLILIYKGASRKEAKETL